MHDSNPIETFSHVLHALNRFKLAYAHVIMSTKNDLEHGEVPVPLAALRKEFHGPLVVVANGFTYASATQALAENLADAVAFGRLFITNPDLPERLHLNGPLAALDEATLYGGAKNGIYRLARNGATIRRKMMNIQTEAMLPKTLKRVGIAADHGGFELKEFLAGKFLAAGYEVTDFGDRQLKSDDGYPDFIVPLARAVAAGTVDRGVGICGSEVGASITANKVDGVRA
jgi:hypothetical protein